jgi:hypothetical protein
MLTKEGKMKKLGWLSILVLPMCLGGCEWVKPRVCPDPGAITNNSCIYSLTITKPSPAPDLAIGKVPEQLVEANSRRRMWGNMWRDFDPKTYPHFEYVFHVKNADSLTVNKTYEFVNEPGTYFLKLCDLDCNARRLQPEYPDKSLDEIKQCLAEDKCWMW